MIKKLVAVVFLTAGLAACHDTGDTTYVPSNGGYPDNGYSDNGYSDNGYSDNGHSDVVDDKPDGRFNPSPACGPYTPGC
jgi:hypothetical protein